MKTELKKEDPFKLLDHLGLLGAEDLLKYFTSENIQALRNLADRLQEGMDLETVLSERRFVQIVQELYQVRWIWARKLDETLINASQEFDCGNRVQALWIINGFIRFCPSPHYRSLAEEAMEGYEKE